MMLPLYNKIWMAPPAKPAEKSNKMKLGKKITVLQKETNLKLVIDIFVLILPRWRS